jgi:hypothetical protein
MSVDPKKYKSIMKKKASKTASENNGTPPKKQSSGSKSFDDAIDKMLKTKK